MAVPTSYTDEELSQFLESRLGHTAGPLGWSVGANGGDYEEVIIDTLLAMGLSAVSAVPEARIAELRALATVHLWRSVAAAFSGDYDFSADGGNYSRSQLQEHAERRLEEAERRAMAYDDVYTVTSQPVTYHRDPYGDHDDALTDDIDDYQDQLRNA